MKGDGLCNVGFFKMAEAHDKKLDRKRTEFNRMSLARGQATKVSFFKFFS